ncbi:MAG: hypothetical protein IT337_00325 [Thermomicrobiales bacterium]|nr:hypothetical protein [Thermomicrobiales bacterium]
MTPPSSSGFGRGAQMQSTIAVAEECALMLVRRKALLEHRVLLNLAADRFP